MVQLHRSPASEVIVVSRVLENRATDFDFMVIAGLENRKDIFNTKSTLTPYPNPLDLDMVSLFVTLR